MPSLQKSEFEYKIIYLYSFFSKRRLYASLTLRFQFEPVSLETAILFGKTTEVHLKEIGRRISEVSGNCRETYWLEQRIGLAVQRGMALSIISIIIG